MKKAFKITFIGSKLTSALKWARPPPLRLVGRLAPPRDMVSMETLRPRMALYNTEDSTSYQYWGGVNSLMHTCESEP